MQILGSRDWPPNFNGSDIRILMRDKNDNSLVYESKEYKNVLVSTHIDVNNGKPIEVKVTPCYSQAPEITEGAGTDIYIKNSREETVYLYRDYMYIQSLDKKEISRPIHIACGVWALLFATNKKLKQANIALTKIDPHNIVWMIYDGIVGECNEEVTIGEEVIL